MKRTSLYYWLIVVLLMFATALSFMDRQVLSISILKIREELGITDVEYGFINSGTPTATQIKMVAEVRSMDEAETYYMYTTLANALTGEATTIELYGDVDVDGTLEIEDGGYVKYGTDGTNVAIVEINGTMNVAENTTLDDIVYVEGTLAVAENTTVTVAGSMQVNGTVTGGIRGQ